LAKRLENKNAMTLHCHKCGKEWTLDGQPGRSESCHSCNEDLRICLNCTFYDAGVAYQCRERRAEPVIEKHRSNFCEYFDFAQRDWYGKEGKNDQANEVRNAFEKLFGD